MLNMFPKKKTPESIRAIISEQLQGKSIASQKIMLTKYKKQAVDHCLTISDVWQNNELGNRWYLGDQVTRRQVNNAALEVAVLFRMRKELDQK